jgi:pyridoxine/pyridoxamine 5'-phosphate oxidase
MTSAPGKLLLAGANERGSLFFMVRFTKAELLDYMSSHRLAVVSSIGPLGNSQAALVGVAISPRHEVIFDTVADSRKHANLLRDPRASVVFSGPAERTLQLEGIARSVSVSGAQDVELRSLYYEVWPEGRDRLSWPKLSYWCVAPQWACYSDFDRGPLIAEFRWP